MKVCNKCGKEKTLNSFHNCQRCSDGKNPVCSICINTGNRVRRGCGEKDGMDFRAGILSIKDYCRTLEILGQMGYDTTKNIHEQFCEKFNLPTKELPFSNKLNWSYQDCINNEQ